MIKFEECLSFFPWFRQSRAHPGLARRGFLVVFSLIFSPLVFSNIQESSPRRFFGSLSLPRS